MTRRGHDRATADQFQFWRNVRLLLPIPMPPSQDRQRLPPIIPRGATKGMVGGVPHRPAIVRSASPQSRRRRVGGAFRGRRDTLDPVEPRRQVGERSRRCQFAAQVGELPFEFDTCRAFGGEPLFEIAVHVGKFQADRTCEIPDTRGLRRDLFVHPSGPSRPRIVAMRPSSRTAFGVAIHAINRVG